MELLKKVIAQVSFYVVLECQKLSQAAIIANHEIFHIAREFVFGNRTNSDHSPHLFSRIRLYRGEEKVRFNKNKSRFEAMI